MAYHPALYRFRKLREKGRGAGNDSSASTAAAKIKLRAKAAAKCPKTESLDAFLGISKKKTKTKTVVPPKSKKQNRCDDNDYDHRTEHHGAVGPTTGKEPQNTRGDHPQEYSFDEENDVIDLTGRTRLPSPLARKLGLLPPLPIPATQSLTPSSDPEGQLENKRKTKTKATTTTKAKKRSNSGTASSTKRKRSDKDKLKGTVDTNDDNDDDDDQSEQKTTKKRKTVVKAKGGNRTWDHTTDKRVLVYDIGEINLVDVIMFKVGGRDEYAIERMRKTNLRTLVGSSRALGPDEMAKAIHTYLLQTIDELDLQNEPLDAIVVELQQVGPLRLKMMPHLIKQFFTLYFSWRAPTRGDASFTVPKIEFQTGAQKFRVVVDTTVARRIAGPEVTVQGRPLSLWEQRRAVEANDLPVVSTVSSSFFSLPSSTSLIVRKGVSKKSNAAASGRNATSAYAENKAYAVQQCKLFLKAYPRCGDQWLSTFKRESKQDDLADAIIHALFYLNVGSNAIKASRKRKGAGVDVDAGVIVLRGETHGQGEKKKQ